MPEQLIMAELKNKAMSFDRAEMRDIHAIKEPIDGQARQDYLSKRHMGVWNTDKSLLACIAPKSYMVIQHRHATEQIIEAITSLNIKATAELKTSKHGIHINFDFPESKFELKDVGDEYTTGIQVVNRYDQVAGLVISPRVTRLVCSNGMTATNIVNSQRIKYTEQLKQTSEGLIDKMINDIITNDEKLANMVSICMKDSIEWQALRLLTKAIFRRKKDVQQILLRIDANKKKFTRWDFYNAVTNYATHGERLKPHIEDWLQNKANEIMKKPFEQLTEESIKVEVETEVSS